MPALLRNRTDMQLEEIVARLPKAHVVVIGDPMYDEYRFGRVTRICPEAPVPVFVPESLDVREGGAANVAENLWWLGVDAARIFPTTQWTVKRRFVAQGHLVLRVDEVRDAIPSPEVLELVAATLKRQASGAVLVLSDYGRGWLSPELCKVALEGAAAAGMPSLVDPHGTDWSKYKGCSLICPNDAEYEAGQPGDFLRVLRKQGAAGMTLYDRCSDEDTRVAPYLKYPAVDVTGAGDTVIATVAAAVAVGATYLEAAQLAAVAAGYVVGRQGTAVCPREILKLLVKER